MTTSTHTALAELKMHVRSEHQEKLTKLQMKHLFDHRSRNSFLDPEPTSTPPDPEDAITHSALPTPSETSTSGLSHLILNDIEGDELGLAGANNPISLNELFNFNSDRWTGLYDSQGRKHLAEELAICEFLSQDAMTDKGMEVDINEIMSEILMA